MGDHIITQVAEDLDLTEAALRKWVKRADIDAGKGLPEALTSGFCAWAKRPKPARVKRDAQLAATVAACLR
jgi:transposase